MWKSGWSGEFGSGRASSGQFDLVKLSGHGFGRVGSGIRSSSVGSYQVGSGRLLGHLVSGHFGFWVVSGWSGRLSGHLVLGYFGFRIVSSQVGLVNRSSSVGSFHILRRIRSGRVGYRVI
jgi:hypothetical protein